MLKVQGLDAWYDTSHVVQGLDFEVQAGEIVMRISAIVDARFSLIVDGEAASSRVRRGGAQAPGLTVP